MSTQPIILYGIRNCDTVKKARRWLDDQSVAYTFHDFKSQGVPPERLDHWLTLVGWETLLNRKGTTWRKLDPAVQSGAADTRGARAVMLKHASVIRRPVVEWGRSAAVSVGFDARHWQDRVQP